MDFYGRVGCSIAIDMKFSPATHYVCQIFIAELFGYLIWRSG